MPALVAATTPAGKSSPIFLRKHKCCCYFCEYTPRIELVSNACQQPTHTSCVPELLPPIVTVKCLVDQVTLKKSVCCICRWLAAQVAPSVTCLAGTLDSSVDAAFLLQACADGAIGEYTTCNQNFCQTISVSPTHRCMQLQDVQGHLSSCVYRALH